MSGRIYRVDKFVVLNAAREEFLGKSGRLHLVLRTCPAETLIHRAEPRSHFFTSAQPVAATQHYGAT